MEEGMFWAALAGTAAVSGLAGYVLGSARRCRVAVAEEPPVPAAPVLRALAEAQARLELAAGGADPAALAACSPGQAPAREAIAACVVRSVGPHGLLCEPSRFADLAELAPGRVVTCFFPPRREQGRKVNAFQSAVLDVDAKAEPPSVTLALPAHVLELEERLEARKRVADPGLVRVRLWLAEADESPVHFPDAAPDLWINAYDGGAAEENAVTDISEGGLSMRLRAGMLPPGLAAGAPVVLKCSVFEFREKLFKPRWRAGVVRGVSAPAGKSAAALVRVAVGFTLAGRLDESARQGLAWSALGESMQQGEAK